MIMLEDTRKSLYICPQVVRYEAECEVGCRILKKIELLSIYKCKNIIMAKKIITENKVILNERGEVEFILNEETSRLGHVSIEEGKRLIAQIIMQKKRR